MIRAFVVAIAVVTGFVDARRVAVKSNSGSDSPFVASCEDLQGTFRSRVAAVQAFLDATNVNGTGVSPIGQVRITMRVYGVVRTLRRARNCQWVLDGNSEDVERARSVVQQVLARNPCAEAAMGEITAEAFESASNEFQPLQRAMLVLLSDTCEVEEVEEEEEENGARVEDEAALEELLDEEEEAAQDHMDELVEQAALAEEGGSSFLQTEAQQKMSLATVFRVISAVFFGLLFAMICIPIGAAIGAVIGLILMILGLEAGMFRGNDGIHIAFIFGGAIAGGAVGFGTCAAGLVSEFLPSNVPGSSASRRIANSPPMVYSRPYN